MSQKESSLIQMYLSSFTKGIFVDILLRKIGWLTLLSDCITLNVEKGFSLSCNLFRSK